MASMTREEVLGRLCALATEVGRSHLEQRHDVNCFCTTNPRLNFHFSSEVIEFIEQAVKEKIAWNKIFHAEEDNENQSG